MPRPKGIPNKNKQRLIVMLEKEYPGYHPLMAMAKIAHETDDIDLEFAAHKEICGYIVPKLKAMEISGDQENPLSFNITIGNGSD